MSNLIDQASLVMIPSGYKEDKIYSQVPTDGSGDLTFTRSSDGTRVNSQGLVERVPWNELEQSETFDNATWQKSGIAVTANSAANPLTGLTNADNLVAENVTNFHYIYQPITYTTDTYTIFVYLKANGYNWFVIDSGLSNKYSYFNLSTGVLGATGSGATASIESVGNGWYKCGLTYAGVASSSGIYLSVRNADNGGSFTGNGTGGVLAYGAQLNIGSTAKPYFPTTDRLNVPRLDYSNGCPSLLLEPQRTNLLTYSNGFDNAYWDKANQGVGSVAVVTPNYTTSPDGTNNAFRFQCNLNGGTTTNDRSWMLANFTAQATSNLSIYIKLNSAGTKTFIFSDSGGNTKTISNTEWERIDGTFSGGSGEFRIGLIGSLTSDTLDCSIAFAQAEGGSYPTSYIPTTSASVTRVADAAQLLGMASGVADGATSATLLLELECINESANDAFCFGQSSSFYPPGRGYIYNKSNGFADSFGGGGFTIPENENVKMIFRLNSLSSTNIFQNGVKGPTRTGTAWSQIEQIAIRGAYASMKVKQMVFFPTALTDAECIALTS